MSKYIYIMAITLMVLTAACSLVSAPQPSQVTPPAPPPSVAIPGQTAAPYLTEGGLPQPLVTVNSVEICLNSRYSQHSLSGTATNQQISNILWAAGKAPLTGGHRDILVNTATGRYLYKPGTHALSAQPGQAVSGGALMLSCDSDLAFDTGLAYMLAILGSVSLGKSSEQPVASCPKGADLFFGVQEGRGLTSEPVAHCSLPKSDPGWLPDPSTDGQNKLEDVLANLNYVNQFSPANLSLQQISQLLWAGYGCTPHEVAGGKKGLTVPSAMAAYYLTNTIYLANEKGMYRYHDRKPDADLTTRDHRLEPLMSVDVRNKLAAAVIGLPSAPCYVIICLGQNASSARGGNWALEEAGFVGANMLVQASAIGLGCNFKADLAADQQTAIREATSIPSTETPQVIISTGIPAVR